MNSIILIPLCITAWVFTLNRLKAIFANNTRKIGSVAFNIWAMSFFLSVTLTFMIQEFAVVFNSYTWPNLSILISHSTVLLTAYFGSSTSLGVIAVPISKKIVRWTTALLCVVLVALLMIYIFFISRITASPFFEPHSLPEVIFKFITCFFGIMLSLIMALTHWTYLPSKKITLMRLRGIVIILCSLSTSIYLLVRALNFGGYFWPFLQSSVSVVLSYAFLTSSTILFFFTLASDNTYMSMIRALKSIDTWHTFQDLQYLSRRLLKFCPTIGLPLENPGLLRFLLKPEYYLYRTVITILDSKVLLDDFLTESMKPGRFPMWEGNMLEEALRVNQVLQAVNPSNDFTDIVDTYRRISRDLLAGQI